MSRTLRNTRRSPAVLLVAILCALGLATSAQAASQTVLSLRLDETSGRTAYDSSGLKNHGTFGSGVTVGQKGSSYLFTTGHITVKTASSLNPGTKPFSFSLDVAWDTRVPTSAARDVDLMRKGLASTSGGSYKMELKPQPTCFFKGAGATEKYVASSRNVLDGAFHSITCRRSGSTLSITVDGATTSRSIAIGTIGNSSPLTIGSKPDGGDQTRGYLRNVRVAVG
ncbi:LamG-like jellyroll fold domain-containing protein [Pengzhenrongella frigida]|uniref:LamG domain-containing protein n=1 Tax=Pengzhenrongella frigida TaxID=1259133 RepID=A0A4Q5N3B8_9MICO|nr:LamG-like jellyroll fold domain-containing protein [Cellulomonas sp. HLT2-17]RYV51753.1 hypothetical protein EUA98_06685 [Cellulomonas sp. HLT2-17]